MIYYRKVERHILKAMEENKQRSLIGSLLRGVSAAITGTFLVYFLSGIIQILLVRQLGRIIYGEYATITATLGLIASMLGFGLDVWVLSEGGRDKSGLARNISYVLRAKLFFLLILFTVTAIAWLYNYIETPIYILGILGIAFDSFGSTFYSALRVINKNGIVAIIQVFTQSAILMVIWFMQKAGLDIFSIFALQTICSGLVVMLLFVILRSLVGDLISYKFELNYIVRGAWLFVFADILSNTYTQSSLVILGRMVDKEAVGLWKPALNVVSLTFVVPSLLFLVGLPQLNSVAQEKKKYQKLIFVMAVGAVLYGLIVLIGLWFFGEVIIRTLFGVDYLAALPLIKVMSLVPLLKSGSFVCVTVILSLNRQKLRVGLQAIVTIVSVIGGFVIIPIFGLYGAVLLYVFIEGLIFFLYTGSVIYLLRGEWK